MTALLEQPQHAGRLMRFSLSLFEQMLELGLIADDARVELLDGQIVELPEMNQPHVNAIKHLYDGLQRIFSTRADVYAQSPIRLPSDGRPLPAVFMVHLGAGLPETPNPESVYLLIEVAASSLNEDRKTKLALYARDNIKEYWILNLVDKQLEIYRDPKDETYITPLVLEYGQLATSLAFPNNPIDWFSSLEPSGGSQ